MLKEQDYWASGYNLMWVIVMFDLPVVEKTDRKAATKFRNYLLDEGFAMGQYSVYYRLLAGKEAVTAISRRIQDNLPKYGVVQVVPITDKQYENIQTFRGKARESQEKPDQLFLF